ncbi:TIGR02679 family protein [Burkholderia sp. Ac-20345]|uniref:TIGR02679 family protein n=1 Tax=Burkholderia sp. Ac-20345 TaxID=2703891 RepID=UPI00197B124D|nr:TIGR02679 family protein [Burkholderia sp. Ac-20345]MBN3777268.1 TIGR02679 family protein [Burkholderia sp. Ac-20345]
MTRVDARLERLLGGDELAPLRRQLRRRFERESLDDPVREIRLSGLAPHERDALAQITGSRSRSSASIVLDLAEVDRTLSDAGVAPSLRTALEQLDGPIFHIASVRAAETARWNDVVSVLEHPHLTQWLSVPANLGIVKRLSASDHVIAEQICRDAEAVLARLPANGTALAHLAADVLGDAHGLDAGRPVATVAISVMRRSEPQDEALLAEDDRVRSVWARAGVMVNELARPALYLNVPFSVTDGSAAFTLGNPSYASLRWLMRSNPQWDVHEREVFVCENPNVVTIAADHLGRQCLPLVCTDGMPAAAQRILLSQLRAAGAVLRYHGDFDWPGIRIANLVIREHDANSWRMSENDYVAAVERSQGRGSVLSGAEIVAMWEPSLSSQMTEYGIGISEEAVIAPLLSDLARD